MKKYSYHQNVSFLSMRELLEEGDPATDDMVVPIVLGIIGSIILCILLMLCFVSVHYGWQKKKLAHILNDAEECIMNSITIIDYKGDENTRNSNKVRSKINKYYLKKNANKNKNNKI